MYMHQTIDVKTDQPTDKEDRAYPQVCYFELKDFGSHRLWQHDLHTTIKCREVPVPSVILQMCGASHWSVL